MHQVVPAGELEEALEQKIALIWQAGPHAVAAAKNLLHNLAGKTAAEAADLTTECIAELRVSPEGQEGIRALPRKTQAEFCRMSEGGFVIVEKRKLGRQGPEITTVGFGAWAAGGPWKVGWGPQSDEDLIAAIRRSLELGCNWIDTAAIYGLGHSEVVVGQAIADFSREQVFVATKCGVCRTKRERRTATCAPTVFASSWRRA